MKKILSGLFCLMIGIVCYGQAPQAFSYQAVAIGDNGSVLTNQAISVQVNINAGNPAGTTTYSEIHEAITSDAGLFSIDVGFGNATTGVFSEIAWSTGAYFLSVEVDENGTGNYQNIGVSQLLSVPYALHAENGIPGPAGPMGPTGPQGVQGPQGYPGSPGPIGPTPPGGGQGPVGDPGAPGMSGANGGSTHCWDLNNNLVNDLEEDINQDGLFSALDCVGKTGPEGLAGPAGPQGVDSNEVGPQGLEGWQGSKGNVGPEGLKGQTIECSPWVKSGENISFLGNVGVGTSIPNCALDVAGDISSYGLTLSSDLRYKENIEALEGMLSKVLELEGVHYGFKTEEFTEREFSDALQVGLIAQEVEKVFPELVTTKADGYKAVNYSKLSPILLEALRSLNAEMETEEANFSKQYELLNAELDNLKAILTEK